MPWPELFPSTAFVTRDDLLAGFKGVHRRGWRYSCQVCPPEWSPLYPTNKQARTALAVHMLEAHSNRSTHVQVLNDL